MVYLLSAVAFLLLGIAIVVTVYDIDNHLRWIQSVRRSANNEPDRI